MARLILTLWFTAATLLGPGLCCCLTSAKAAPPVAAKPVEPKCPHCAKKQGQSPAKAPAKECPCKKDSRCPVAARVTAQAPEVNPVRALVDSCAALLSLDNPTKVDPAATASHEEHSAWLPFCNTDDLLYGCHILRC